MTTPTNSKIVTMLPVTATRRPRRKCANPSSYYSNDTQKHYIKASVIDDSETERHLATIMSREVFLADY